MPIRLRCTLDREGDVWRLAANLAFRQNTRRTMRALGTFPWPEHSPIVAVQSHACGPHCAYPRRGCRSGYPDARSGWQAADSLGVPLLREGEAIGVIVLARQRVEPFTDRQIELVSTFADQAVIAMENTRLITEQREALEQQTATAEVLQVINASPGNLAPVFDAMLEKAHAAVRGRYGQLCYLRRRAISTRRGDAAAARTDYADAIRFGQSVARPRSMPEADRRRRFVHVPDMQEQYPTGAGREASRSIVELGRCAHCSDGAAAQGRRSARHASAHIRQEVRPFSDKEIALLENFAAQAVIAMENARLLDEIRQRQEELRVTFENMGDGVAMFDETPHLVAWNRKFQDILDLPDDILAERLTLSRIHPLPRRAWRVWRGGRPGGADTPPHRASRSISRL